MYTLFDDYIRRAGNEGTQKAHRRIEQPKVQFCISSDMFTKWRRLKEE